MQITCVQYVVVSEFVQRNEANIKAVMDAARALAQAGIKYSSYHLGDGRFMHLAVFADDDAKKALTSLPEFAHFQAELKANIVEPPNAAEAQLVGATFDWF